MGWWPAGKGGVVSGGLRDRGRCRLAFGLIRNKRNLILLTISECEEEAGRGNLTADSLTGISANNWFYSMVSRSLEYWPEDEAVVSSILETVGHLPVDGETFVEKSVKSVTGTLRVLRNTWSPSRHLLHANSGGLDPIAHMLPPRIPHDCILGKGQTQIYLTIWCLVRVIWAGMMQYYPSQLPIWSLGRCWFNFSEE